MRKILFGALSVFVLFGFIRENNIQEKGQWVAPS